ncbi:hypothetical protein CALCODRAFT_513335 [Calocera cornea HHB12733]|uniref:Uncharacterized protein n=1 Tax=Calocera cornea HHB12733 TaxID=1353952 RepID=A0A165C7D4_9BASI|nr:hypothetical protein CALCODRAFT_513335 [Calocera cornea HHB12733]
MPTPYTESVPLGEVPLDIEMRSSPAPSTSYAAVAASPPVAAPARTVSPSVAPKSSRAHKLAANVAKRPVEFPPGTPTRTVGQQILAIATAPPPLVDRPPKWVDKNDPWKGITGKDMAVVRRLDNERWQAMIATEKKRFPVNGPDRLNSKKGSIWQRWQTLKSRPVPEEMNPYRAIGQGVRRSPIGEYYIPDIEIAEFFRDYSPKLSLGYTAEQIEQWETIIHRLFFDEPFFRGIANRDNLGHTTFLPHKADFTQAMRPVDPTHPQGPHEFSHSGVARQLVLGARMQPDLIPSVRDFLLRRNGRLPYLLSASEKESLPAVRLKTGVSLWTKPYASALPTAHSERGRSVSPANEEKASAWAEDIPTGMEQPMFPALSTTPTANSEAHLSEAEEQDLEDPFRLPTPGDGELSYDG